MTHLDIPRKTGYICCSSKFCLIVLFCVQVTAVEATKRGGDKKSSRKKDHRGSISETGKGWRSAHFTCRLYPKNQPMQLSFTLVLWFSDFTEAPQKPAQRQENTTEKQEVNVQHRTCEMIYEDFLFICVLFVFQRKVLEEPVQRSSPIVSLSSATQTVPASSNTETPAGPPASDKTPVQTQNVSSSHSVSVTPSTSVSKPPGQTAPVFPTAEPSSDSSQSTQNTPLSSFAPTQVTPVISPNPVQAPATVPDAPVKTTPPIQTAPPISKSAPSLIPAPTVPVSAPLPAPFQTSVAVLDTPHQSSTAPPTDVGNAPPFVQPTVDIHTAELAQAPPPITPNTSEPRPCESPASGKCFTKTFEIVISRPDIVLPIFVRQV